MRNTRDDVVAAALRVLDAQGLEGCSMRRVAAELDVQPSALYHHVPNKQYLLALMADDIVASVGRPTAHAANPRSLCIELRNAMLAIRDGADVVATATAFRLGVSTLEAQLAQLAGADGARTLLLFTFGHAQSTQTHLQAAAFGALIDPPSEKAPGNDGASTQEAPTARNLDASFERGLDIILAGLHA